MGSYSMNCGLSGLEIAEQQPCYVVMLKPDCYEWECATAPVRGTYQDSGGHRVDESDRDIAAAFGLPIDQHGYWTPLDVSGPTPNLPWMPMWIDGAVFEGLEGLASYELQGATIAECYDGTTLPEIEKAIAKACADRAKYAGFGDALAELDKRDIWGYPLKSLLGGESSVHIDGVANLLNDRIGADEPYEDLLRGIRRGYVLGLGTYILRRYLVPQNGSRGPQHGGSDALVAFHEIVLAEAKARAGKDAAKHAEWEE